LAFFFVLGVAVCAIVYGLHWHYRPHWQQLDYKGKASYIYSFCIHQGQGQRYNPNNKWIQNHTKIASDLDLLVMMLYRYDKGHGKTFFEIQLDNSLEEKWTKGFEEYVAFSNDLAMAPSTISRDDLSRVPNEVKILVRNIHVKVH
jgi:hypothetical protein